MHLNHEKDQVWCQACLAWHNINTETLWLVRDDDKKADIVCLQYPEVHLGYASDLE